MLITKVDTVLARFYIGRLGVKIFLVETMLHIVPQALQTWLTWSWNMHYEKQQKLLLVNWRLC